MVAVHLATRKGCVEPMELRWCVQCSVWIQYEYTGINVGLLMVRPACETIKKRWPEPGSLWNVDGVWRAGSLWNVGGTLSLEAYGMLMCVESWMGCRVLNGVHSTRHCMLDLKTGLIAWIIKTEK